MLIKFIVLAFPKGGKRAILKQILAGQKFSFVLLFYHKLESINSY